MATEISLIKEAREIVRAQPRSVRTDVLRNRADKLAEAYDLIKVSCTRTAIQNLVACATLVAIAIAAITATEPNPPQEGSGVSSDNSTTVAKQPAVA